MYLGPRSRRRDPIPNEELTSLYTVHMYMYSTRARGEAPRERPSHAGKAPVDQHTHAHFRTLARSTTRYHDVRVHSSSLSVCPDVMPVVTVVTWVRLRFEAHDSGSALTSALGSIHADK